MIKICRLLKYLKVKSLSVFFIILVPNKELRKRKNLINHARIHLKQQRELWYAGFFFLYTFYQIKSFIHLMFHKRPEHLETRSDSRWVLLRLRLYEAWVISKASNPLELEAMFNERKWTYLRDRKPFSFKKYHELNF